MDKIQINTERCKKDGFCVEECPMKIIKMESKDSFPELVAGGEELCIQCGHCLSVCPHGALTLDGLSPDDVPQVNKELIPSAEQIKHFLHTRRSIRVFKDKPVDKEIIEKCIEFARYAPTGHNSQTVNWLVIHDTKKLKEMGGIVADWMRMVIEANPKMAEQFHLDLVVEAWDKGEDKILRGTPHIVVAHGDRNVMATPTSCTIALAHFELAAYALGVGATWAGFFHGASAVFPPMVQALNLPENHQAFGAMMIGHPKYKHKRIPPRVPARISWI